MFEIYGGEVLAFGDLHFSDVFTGKHKDYLVNCTKVLADIERIINERKPSAVVFLGDIVGWTETNIKSREVLSMFLGFWRRINQVCTVFAVRGNHDMKGYPDFNLLEELGYIKTPSYFDFYRKSGGTEPDIRFHLVPYGSEHKLLSLAEGGTTNVVLGHNNYTISGYTTWYPSHDGIEVGTLENYVGVSLIVSGHIHKPSPELYGATMVDGSVCNLYYVGCPTRPVKEDYDNVGVATFLATDTAVEFDVLNFPLISHEEIYYSDDEFIEELSEDVLAESLRKEALAEVLSDIIKYRMLGGDIRKQVDAIPNATEEAKEMCKQYLEIAMK